MSHFKHAFRLYARRFWKEAAAFWIVSGVASWMALRGPGNYPHAAFSVLEGLTLLCAVVRLMQAENVFRTLGGWRVRPVRGSTLRRARWTLLFLMLTPAIAARVTVTALIFSPGIEEWSLLATSVWLPLLLGIALGGAAAGMIGRDAWAGQEHRYPALAGGVVLGACGMVLGFVISRQSPVTNSWGGGTNVAPLLTAASGDIEGGKPKMAAGAALLVRLPARAGATTDFGGSRAEITECTPEGKRLLVTVEITAPSAVLRPAFHAQPGVQGRGASLFIRYGDGNWAGSLPGSHLAVASSLPGLSAEKFVFGNSFATPLILPENTKTGEELLAGAEVFLFDRCVPGNPPRPRVVPDDPAALAEKTMPTDLPGLLERLKLDPVAGERMIAKGWTQEALPLLRSHLLAGLPLGEKSLSVLIGLRDPALAGALHRAMVTTRVQKRVFLLSVRDHPGIDWPALAMKAWRRNNFRPIVGEEMERNPWIFPAAAAGHRPALLDLAAQWCVKAPGKSEIAEVIARGSWNGEVNEFPAWLHANLERLQWNRDLARWEIPDSP